MSLFYFDEKIRYYEQRLDYSPIINYLEDLYNSTKDVKIFVTLIASAWYYMVEGDVNQKPVNYDWDFLKSKLKDYIDIGLEMYADDERFNYVAGYLLNLHWMYIGNEYEKVGLELMKKCSEISKDINIKILSLHFLKTNQLISKDLIQLLFPSESELDTYFSSILNQ